MFPSLQVVDSVAANATVRLDLSDGAPLGLGAEGFGLGVPSYAGEPGSVGVGYGFRTLELPLQVYADNASARAAWSALAAEMARPWNLLRWQINQAADPLFYRVWRTAPGPVDYSDVHVQDGWSFWRAPQSWVADPHAYGLPESGSATISNDAGAAGGLFARLPTVRGDMAAPLRLVAAAQQVAGRRVLVVSQALVGASQPAAEVVLAPAMSTFTAGFTRGGVETLAGPALMTGDAAMSGTGSYYRIDPWPADVGLWRTALRAPVTPALVGDYRVLLRVRASDVAADWLVRGAQVDAAGATYALTTGPSVDYSVRTTSGPHWLDLGRFRLPFGAPPAPAGLSGSGVSPDGHLLVQVQAADATATLDVDAAVFVPAGLDAAVETRTSWTATDKSLPTDSYQMVLDGADGDTRFLLSSNGTLAPGIGLDRAGSLPVVVPGADNSLHFFRHVGIGYADLRTGATGGSNDAVASSTTVTWSYHPRYALERPPGG